MDTSTNHRTSSPDEGPLKSAGKPTATNIAIRKEQPVDIAAIVHISEAAFRHHPHSSPTKQHIISGHRQDGELTLSIAAEENRTVIGLVAVSPVTFSPEQSGWHGLGSISVRPDRQRQSIDTRLTTAALDRLQVLDVSGCVVLGDPDYYGRFGCSNHPHLVLPGVPPEHFQALAFRGQAPAGSAPFPRAFGAAE